MGANSQLWKPSVAGAVTELYEGLVGRGVTGFFVVLACFVGLMSCLAPGLEVLAGVVLEIDVFKGLTLDIVVLGATILTEFFLGLDGVALEGVALGFRGIFLVEVG